MRTEFVAAGFLGCVALYQYACFKTGEVLVDKVSRSSYLMLLLGEMWPFLLFVSVVLYIDTLVFIWNANSFKSSVWHVALH